MASLLLTVGWPILKGILIKLAAQQLIERVGIEVLEHLAKQSTNTLDDKVVAEVKQHFQQYK